MLVKKKHLLECLGMQSFCSIFFPHTMFQPLSFEGFTRLLCKYLRTRVIPDRFSRFDSASLGVLYQLHLLKIAGTILQTNKSCRFIQHWIHTKSFFQASLSNLRGQSLQAFFHFIPLWDFDTHKVLTLRLYSWDSKEILINLKW